MPLRALRASKAFTVFVVCLAVFSDVFLQNLVVPVLPYALKVRVGLKDEVDLQWWNSLLLAAFGGAFMLGSCKYGVGLGSFACVLLLCFLVFWGRDVDGMGRGGWCGSLSVYVREIVCQLCAYRNVAPSSPNQICNSKERGKTKQRRSNH